MGCSSSSEVKLQLRKVQVIGQTKLSKKPSIWFIGGGPGSSKGKISQMLVEQYKFRYLSTYDIVQFEQERGGRDAEAIKKIFIEKTHIPSQLLVKLMKKAIASYGTQRFLIDGFPATSEDLMEFNSQLSEHVQLEGYIHIKISETKMRQSAMATYKEEKINNLENVDQLIKKYMNESQRIKRQFEKMRKLKQISGEMGSQSAYKEIQTFFKMRKIQKPDPTPVLFLSFDKVKNQTPFIECIVEKFGFHYCSIVDIVEYIKQKNIEPERTRILSHERKKQAIPAPLIGQLIKLKIEKYGYSQKYCISGYPRTKEEYEEWKKIMEKSANTVGFLNFDVEEKQFRKLFQIKTKLLNPSIPSDQLQSNFQFYQKSHSELSSYFQSQKLYKNIILQSKPITQMEDYLRDQDFSMRSPINSKEIIFVSTLCNSGDALCDAAMKEGAAVINLEKIFLWESEQNGLYSELMKSFVENGKPIPGNIAVEYLKSRLKTENRSGNIIIKGFPNSLNQLQVWNQEIGESIKINETILYEFNRTDVDAYYKQKPQIQQSFVEKTFIQYINIECQNIEEKLANKKYSVLKREEKGREQAQTKQLINSWRKAGFFT